MNEKSVTSKLTLITLSEIILVPFLCWETIHYKPLVWKLYQTGNNFLIGAQVYKDKTLQIKF